MDETEFDAFYTASFARLVGQLYATTIIWTTYEEDTGYDSVTVGSTYETALGGSIVQVTRVGRAVVAIARSGEWSLETAPAGAAEVTGVTREVAAGMCRFTEAGC